MALHVTPNALEKKKNKTDPKLSATKYVKKKIKDAGGRRRREECRAALIADRSEEEKQ